MTFYPVSRASTTPQLADGINLLIKALNEGVPRSFANVIDYGAVQDSTTDCATAFTNALATGKPVFVPDNGSGNYYAVGSTLNVGGKIIVGADSCPKIKYTASSGNLFTQNANNVTMKNLTLEGFGAAGSGGRILRNNGYSGTYIYNVFASKARQQNYHFTNASKIVVIGGAAKEASTVNSGIELEGCSDFHIERVDLTGNGGFGLFAWKATNSGTFQYNYCENSTLELFGCQFDTYNITIWGNEATQTGDNGISVNGWRHIVGANKCWENDYYGIAIYGSGCVVMPNECWNNGQAGGVGDWSGLVVNPSWGGFGRDNVILGQHCYDTQAVKTQKYPIRLLGEQYTTYWTASEAGITTNTLRRYGDNVYRARSTGTTGATPPTHVSGEASDGTITWVYCGSLARGLYDAHTQWTTGTAVVAGQMVFNGTRVYVAAGSGTTGATAPTHTSGSASDGAVTWNWVRTYPSTIASTGNLVMPSTYFGNVNDFILDTGVGNVVHDHGKIPIRMAGRELVGDILFNSGAPGGTYSARPGSIYMRTAGGLIGKTAYLKVSGTGNTDWQAVALRVAGATADRPTSQLDSTSQGFEYFDTTLGFPVWWSGTGWVKYDGTAA